MQNKSIVHGEGPPHPSLYHRDVTNALLSHAIPVTVVVTNALSCSRQLSQRSVGMSRVHQGDRQQLHEDVVHRNGWGRDCHCELDCHIISLWGTHCPYIDHSKSTQ